MNKNIPRGVTLALLVFALNNCCCANGDGSGVFTSFGSVTSGEKEYIHDSAPFAFSMDTKMPWKWREYDSLYYNLGQTLSKRFCLSDTMADKDKANCKNLLKVSRVPTKHLLTYGPVMIYWNAVVNHTRSCGPFGLHIMAKHLQDMGIESYLYAVSPVWNTILDNKIKQWFSSQHGRTIAAFKNKYESNGIIVVPDGEREQCQNGKMRCARWMLGWHFDVIRDARPFGHVHFNAKVSGSPTSSLWCHEPPKQYMNYVKSHKISTTGKKNIVLVDGDANMDHLIKPLEEGLRRSGIPDAKVILFNGFDTRAVIDLYTQVKVTIDSDMPGAEMINFEGKLFEAVNLIGDNMVGQDTLDFSFLDSKYRVDPRNFSGLLETVKDVLLNYEKHRKIQAAFRSDIFKIEKRYIRDLQITFFSRATLFYTAVKTYSEMRALVPWILAVSSLFPLAKVEILVDDARRFNREFESIRLLLKTYSGGLFKEGYIKIRSMGHNCEPGQIFHIPPEMDGHLYTVFMDVRALVLGRDMLNSHADYLDKHADVIFIGNPSKSPVVVANSRKYWSTLKIAMEQYRRNRSVFPALDAFYRLQYRPFSAASRFVSQLAKFTLPASTLPSNSILNGLPLDALTVAGSGSSFELHLTHNWSVGLDSLTTDSIGGRKLICSVIEALDPIVNGSLWPIVGSFFSNHYQHLSRLHPSVCGYASAKQT